MAAFLLQIIPKALIQLLHILDVVGTTWNCTMGGPGQFIIVELKSVIKWIMAST
jgi:hypothetical protein